MIARATRPVARRALRPAHVGLAGATALSALLTFLRWHQDWNPSEGTYALTARALLHGGDLYGDLVVAQPPGLFVAAAGILALGDGLDLLRVAMVLLLLLSLALVAVAVQRITGSEWAAAATPPLGVLLPWTVHEQGVLLPEAVALPCLAGALVLAPRRRGSAWAGALLAVAVAVKLPMAIPALLGVGAAADRRRAAAAFAGAGALLAGASLAAFGTGVVEDAILAQLDVGRHGPHVMAGLGVQAAWNLAPLALGVWVGACAWRHGWRARDARQWRVALALGAGTALTLASTVKVGTSLATLAPVETMSLPVAVAGAVAWCAQGGARGTRPVVVAALVVFLLAQTASLLAEPRRGGRLFLRPLSPPAWGVRMTREEVDARVAALRRCPSGVASSEGPVVTFRAGRRMPGDQPDVFLPARSVRLAGVARRVVAETRRCPR